VKKIFSFFKLLGPGLVTGASDDDPSGIATYSQAGAQFGYQQLWILLFTTPFMVVIQEMCGRIGMVTGCGVAGVIRRHYAKPILYIILVILSLANIINIGADIAAMAQSIQLLLQVSFIFWMFLIAGISALLEIVIPYKTYAKYLKYTSFVLFAYVITALIVKENWHQILQEIIAPRLSLQSDYLLNIVAILGTTISPYLFFWQSNEEVEERIEQNRQKDLDRKTGYTTKKDLFALRFDTLAGMIFSNLVSFFIIMTAAATLGMHGKLQINTAAQAAQALKPFAGNFAFLLFTIGIVSSGLLAVPVLAGSLSYAIAETFQWKAGLGKKPTRAPVFYGIIAGATILGLLTTFSPVAPFRLLYYSAALNGITAVPLMVIILLIANNKKIMKEHSNSRWSTILGWCITGCMGAASILLLANLKNSS